MLKWFSFLLKMIEKITETEIKLKLIYKSVNWNWNKIKNWNTTETGKACSKLYWNWNWFHFWNWNHGPPGSPDRRWVGAVREAYDCAYIECFYHMSDRHHVNRAEYWARTEPCGTHDRSTALRLHLSSMFTHTGKLAIKCNGQWNECRHWAATARLHTWRMRTKHWL